MVDHADSGRVDFEQLFYLTGSEARDRNDQMGALGCLPCLRGKALAKLGRRVIAAQHKKIVEGCYGAAVARGVDPLVQAVKKIGRSWPVFP